MKNRKTKNIKPNWLVIFGVSVSLLFWTGLILGWTYTYDNATPAGTDDPSEADDRMREIKAAIQERMAVDHFWDLTGTEVSDADAGEHIQITFHVTLADPAQVASKAHLYMQNDELRYQDDTNAAFDLTTAGSLGSAGTDLLAGDAAFGGTLDVTGNIDPTTYETTNGGFIDDNTMATATDTVVASAESVVAYVDTATTNPGYARGWVNFDGQAANGACVINMSHNVTGVAHTGGAGSGAYTISWTTAFPAADYCVVGSTRGDAGGNACAVSPVTPGMATLTIVVVQTDTQAKDDIAGRKIHVAAFGQ